MSNSSSKLFTLIIIIVGMLFLLAGAKMPPLNWIGISWSNFFTDVGLYIAVVGAFQFYYDNRVKHELVTKVAESALSNAKVAQSGVSNFTNNTKHINYETMLSQSEEITIGFHHSARFVDDHVFELRSRGKKGKKTSVLLANPDGRAVNFLSKAGYPSDHIKPEIEKNINRIEQINNEPGVKEKIKMKYHDTILRYAFVHSIEGTWIKTYRNSTGLATTPGIFIRSGSPLYDFYQKDIDDLRMEAQDVTPR